MRAARESFNLAIAGRDLDGIAAVLSDDVILVSGTDSDRVVGRGAQLEIWREDFESANRLIYRRTPLCIVASTLRPIAMEQGT
ncbi:MAG: hypothetical protein GC152_00895 [Alphaproteobacteria bacterium]|nr:hypothetical protein [Alphaproteobacteria bacterium]